MARLYSPATLTLEESMDHREAEKQLGEMCVPDEAIKDYAQEFLDHYRGTLERFFPSLAPFLPLYTRHPYEISIMRIDSNGVIICYRPDTQPSVRLVRWEELDPPLEKMNIFDVSKQWGAMFTMFDFSFRTYESLEAEIYGVRRALSDALYRFWMAITESAFIELCLELLRAEEVRLEKEIGEEERQRFDVFGEVLLTEAAGFRRSERWAFQFKNHQDNRVSAKDLRELEDYLNESGGSIDVICLITSGDLTSIGNNIVVTNPRIRVWDREILNRLVHKHLEVLEKYFTTYPVAIETLNQQFAQSIPGRLKEFRRKLADCPPGRERFADYEKIGTEIWCYLFPDDLGEPKVQRETSDRIERRDALFRNLRKSPFFQRISQRFDADIIIVDFKNYEERIGSGVIEEVANYTNKALGRFLIVVSRKGGKDTAVKAQRRQLEKDTVILSVSDDHMLEMIVRKEAGENPEDVLSDLLDELLMQY